MDKLKQAIKDNLSVVSYTEKSTYGWLGDSFTLLDDGDLHNYVNLKTTEHDYNLYQEDPSWWKSWSPKYQKDPDNCYVAIGLTNSLPIKNSLEMTKIELQAYLCNGVDGFHEQAVLDINFMFYVLFKVGGSGVKILRNDQQGIASELMKASWEEVVSLLAQLKPDMNILEYRDSVCPMVVEAEQDING